MYESKEIKDVFSIRGFSSGSCRNLVQIIVIRRARNVNPGKSCHFLEIQSFKQSRRGYQFEELVYDFNCHRGISPNLKDVWNLEVDIDKKINVVICGTI